MADFEFSRPIRYFLARLEKEKYFILTDEPKPIDKLGRGAYRDGDYLTLTGFKVDIFNPDDDVSIRLKYLEDVVSIKRANRL